MNRGWLLVMLFAAVVRIAVVVLLFENLRADPDSYRELGATLAKEGVFGEVMVFGRVHPRPVLTNFSIVDEFKLITPGSDSYDASDFIIRPTAYRPPLYPLVLSNLTDAAGKVLLWKIAAAHVVFGLLTVWLTFNLGEQLKLGVWAYPAAILTACDPILLNQSALIMTETLATFLAVLALWLLVRWWQRPEWFYAILAGGAIELAVLCRPTFLPWLMLLIPAVIWYAAGWRQKLVAPVMMLFGASLFLIPWGVRNYLEIGKFTITTTHGGYTFRLGNNEEFYRHLRTSSSLESFQPGWWSVFGNGLARPLSTELSDDAAHYAHAFRAIRNEPLMFTYACFYRLYQLFNPLAHPTCDFESRTRTVARYLACLWYLLVYLAAFFGIYQLRGKLLTPPWLFGLLLILAFVAVHTFYWTNLRMRAPLMPFIALLAAAGLQHLAEPWLHARLLRLKNLRSC